MKASWIVAALAATQMLLTGAPLDAQDGRIEGPVVVGRTPVDDAEITLTGQGRRVRTDGDGRFVLEGIPPGQYVVEAESPRWGRAVETVRVVAGRTTPVELSLEAVFHLDEMVVSAGAGATRRSEAYQPASVVTNRELVVLGQATLGETLSREPGVSSTYFGPGASRPVIRGIGGDRVRILEGGVGVGDASSTSPDHAVGIETRTADRIEVIRGPATLLYGAPPSAAWSTSSTARSPGNHPPRSSADSSKDSREAWPMSGQERPLSRRRPEEWCSMPRDSCATRPTTPFPASPKPAAGTGRVSPGGGWRTPPWRTGGPAQRVIHGRHSRRRRVRAALRALRRLSGRGALPALWGTLALGPAALRIVSVAERRGWADGSVPGTRGRALGYQVTR